jgi:hypothetical protein
MNAAPRVGQAQSIIHEGRGPPTGYGAYRFGSVLGTLAGTAVAAIPVIIGVVQTATDSDAIRIGVIWPCAAVYGFALALAGVRLAAVAAAGKMPEPCQVAVRNEMT